MSIGFFKKDEIFFKLTGTHATHILYTKSAFPLSIPM